MCVVNSRRKSRVQSSFLGSTVEAPTSEAGRSHESVVKIDECYVGGSPHHM